MAAVLASGVKPLNWHKLDLSLAGSIQRIDVSLLKSVAAAAVCVFFLGIFLIFLISAHKCNLPSRHICPERKRPPKWPLPVIAILWAFYAKNFILQAVGTLPLQLPPGRCFILPKNFPLWLLPGKWSDFSGWQSLWDHFKTQMQAIIFYQDSPIISPYYQGFRQSLAWLGVSFLFLSLFLALSRKAKEALSIHCILAFLAVVLYLRLAEQDLKPLLYFFPCFIASFHLLFSRVPHPPTLHC